MQWRSAGETRFATPVSGISGLPRAGILRLTAWLGISVRTRLSRAGIRPATWLGISVRTRLLRSLEPAIRAGDRMVGTALLLASTTALAGDKPLASRPVVCAGRRGRTEVASRPNSAGGQTYDTPGSLVGLWPDKSAHKTMPTNWRRGSSPEASRGRLRFNHLTELGMTKIRQYQGPRSRARWLPTTTAPMYRGPPAPGELALVERRYETEARSGRADLPRSPQARSSRRTR